MCGRCGRRWGFVGALSGLLGLTFAFWAMLTWQGHAVAQQAQLGVHARAQLVAGVAEDRLAIDGPDGAATLDTRNPDVHVLTMRSSRCECVKRAGGGVRLYSVTRDPALKHGLNHELSNFRTMVSEAVVSGRLVVLSDSPLQLDVAVHNFDKNVTLDKWADYLVRSSTPSTIPDRQWAYHSP